MKKSHLSAVLAVAALASPFAMVDAQAAPAPTKAATTKAPTTRAATSFTLNGKVIDGGQQVVSVTLETTRFKINPASLTVNTFRVHATGTNPYSSLDPATVSGTYDRDRTITGVSLNRDGDVVVKMLSGEDAPAAFTFAWSASEQRNLMLKLSYSITQRTPITLRGGRHLMLSQLTQGRLVDPEVDAFKPGTTADGLKYRLYTPPKASRTNARPLVVWLHGGGEGGWSKAYNGDLPLVANRGALGFATPAAQRIFRGAYVVAPQADTRWLDNPTMNYAPRVKAMIDQLQKRYHVDRSRIYVVGASNGGYMTLQMTADYPKLFAAQVPVCPAVVFNGKAMITDAQLKAMRTPTWIVQARNDTTLPFVPNGLHAAQLIRNAKLTAYPDVTWAGHTFAGHWSWIYVAHNDPSDARGQHLYQWMAKQHR